MQTKQCSKCKEVKSVDEFHKKKGGKYGVRGSCKVCCLKQVKKYNKEYCQRPEVKERKNAQQRERYQQPEVKERRRKYLQQPEVKERKREYNQQPEVKERRRKYNKEYYQLPEVKERKNAQQRERYQQPEVKKNRRKRNRKRRALKAGINENLTTEEEAFIRKWFKNTCFNCGTTQSVQTKKSKRKMPIDHHNPLVRGHRLEIGNATLLCESCNCSKKDKEPKDFYTPIQLKRIEKILIEMRKKWDKQQRKAA